MSTFFLDGDEIPFEPGQTIMEAAHAAGRYLPHLCWHPDFEPHGSCKLCTVKADERLVSACTTAAQAGMSVENRTPELDDKRRTLLQMLFVEGNHFCPSCEKSGHCLLQATAYEMGMTTPHFDMFYPDRPVDASHPDMLLDFNRCILCELCVRASRDADGKNVFALSGRGIASHLIVNAESGRLADTGFSKDDRAASICPVGVILRKRVGFAVPIGSRKYDLTPVGEGGA
ncbi:MAG: 2Fe-2S iron-sulfur cluster-binding protein [Candidatus Nitricoxidivorans perseverans]|uniref:2Fe-2S iron-sulfur cluster-binding protein n=1 Tax=Candidatus Nitricoxidivorans perseverans TaxID=2975601 RepID=A0AA49FMM6_9PROT|nr:MAG: 2Fe-2S iron-sulfur cluster-binding protein [Candidatus Nitricoxidivorans perseverans]